MRQPIPRGLYTTAMGGKTVYVFDCWKIYPYGKNDFFVDFENVKTGEQEEVNLETFKKSFPHKVDKVEVYFEEVNKNLDCPEKPTVGLYTDKGGKSVVYLYDIWGNSGSNGVEFLFVKRSNSNATMLSWEEFNKKYPHKVEKIQIEFS